MFAGRPVIGIVGGIGSGKSLVAKVFSEFGCLVIDSDRQASEAYGCEEVRRRLREWWGGEAFDASGGINRSAIARKVFADPAERRRLEGLIHPLVGRLRDEAMAAAAGDERVVAYVWDTPLLLEAGLADQCDAIVYVDAPAEERLRRVRESRGWTAAEWAQRENSQLALDKKRKVAKYIIRNTAGAEELRSQVRDALTRILAGKPDGGTAGEAG